MKIRLIPFKKNLIAPIRAHYNDAGIDCFAQKDITLPAFGHMDIDPETHVVTYDTHIVQIPLGFGLKIPDGYVAKIQPRSSMNLKGVLTQTGICDSGFTGEYKAVLINLTSKPMSFKRGDKICQIVVEPIALAEPVLELGEERGEGGFGSTDQKPKESANYTVQQTRILDEITTFCGNECCSNDNCPEEECVLYRIEKNITKENK